MRTYHAFYQRQQKIVQAETSYKAQEIAAKLFKAKKSYEVTVILADVPVDTTTL